MSQQMREDWGGTEVQVSTQIREKYEVPSGNLEPLRTRVEALNKRAKKLGASPIQMSSEFLRTTTWVEEDSFGERINRTTDWHLVVIEGEAPRFQGWGFMATILQEEGGVILAAVPGAPELPLRYRSMDSIGACDHCKHDRYRKVTYILRHDSGEWKQVGSSCIKDFLGHQDPHQIARWAELLGAFSRSLRGVYEEGWGSVGRQETRWPLTEFLGWVASVSRQKGWISRTTARIEEGKIATVDAVIDLFTPPWAGDPRVVQKWKADRAQFQPTERDVAFAEAAVEWAEQECLSKDVALLNDYERNMVVALRADSVGMKTVGLAGSLCAVYYRHVQQEEKKERRKDAAPAPQGRVAVEVTILRIEVRVNNFGSREVMTVEHESGWRAWGTQPASLYETKEGDRVEFTATFEPSHNDTGFAFFKRPSKARVLAKEVV